MAINSNLSDEKYEKILVEIKKGLFSTVYIDFSEELKTMCKKEELV